MQSTSLLYLEYSALGYRAMPQLFEGLSPLPFQALVTRCLLGRVWPMRAQWSFPKTLPHSPAVALAEVYYSSTSQGWQHLTSHPYFSQTGIYLAVHWIQYLILLALQPSQWTKYKLQWPASRFVWLPLVVQTWGLNDQVVQIPLYGICISLDEVCTSTPGTADTEKDKNPSQLPLSTDLWQPNIRRPISHLYAGSADVGVK